MAEPAPLPLPSRQICVGVGDIAATNDPDAVLATYALGSCIGVVAYDAPAKIGGILHLMLPDSKVSPDRAAAQPAMFADTGLREFFRQIAALGADRSRLHLLVAGGAHVLMGQDPFRIGESNQRATLDYLEANGYVVDRTEVGGSVNRCLSLDMATGAVMIKTPQVREKVILGAPRSSQTKEDRPAG